MFQAELVERSEIRALVVNFLPSWWKKHYGITWGERMFYDAEYRMDMDREMRRLLAERFPHLPIGDRNPSRRLVQPSLNNALTPAAFGCEVVLPDDGYARWHHADSYESVYRKEPIELLSHFPFTEITNQTHQMNTLLGTDEAPFYPPMGVLNNAIQLLGDQILGDLLAEPERAWDLLHRMAEHEKRKLSIDAEAGWRGFWYLFNCSVDMIGPGIYHDAVVEHDASIASYSRSLGCGVHVHHCGNFDSFASVYQELGPIQSLEVGFTSTPGIAAMHPTNGGPLYFILDYRILRSGSANQVRRHIKDLVDGASSAKSRLTLLALDLEYDTPDENVAALFETE
jgi:hypothetical protein